MWKFLGKRLLQMLITLVLFQIVTYLLIDLQPGDIVYASQTLYNDGTVPGYPEDGIIAEAGTRGALVNIGHPEEAPNETIYLVRFETGDGSLGQPIGCLPEEITVKSSDGDEA